MQPHQLVIGVVSGLVGVIFGVVPGLLSGLTIGVQNFRDALLFGPTALPRGLTDAELNERHWGLAAVGGGIILFTVAAYALVN